MKKKGFTLVELLGVIVVLAIIALIAVPTIMGVVDKAKKGSLQDSAYGLIEAANLYYAQYLNGKTVRFDINDNNMTTEEENKLIYKGNIKNGTVLINNNGEVTVCINDGKHSAYKNYKDTKVTVVDSKTCTVPENSYIVYLDGETTIKEMTTLELTEALELVNKKIIELENENENLKKELKSTNDNIITSEVILNKVYPVGSIYISVDATNPSELFGGTWEAYASGKNLIGVDLSNDNYSTSGKTGGSSTATLSAANLPSHTHSIPSLSGTALTAGLHLHLLGAPQNGTGDWSGWTFDAPAIYVTNTNGLSTDLQGGHTHPVTTTASTTGAIGSGASFSVQNPYITVYMWKRIN